MENDTICEVDYVRGGPGVSLTLDLGSSMTPSLGDKSPQHFIVTFMSWPITEQYGPISYLKSYRQAYQGIVTVFSPHLHSYLTLLPIYCSSATFDQAK